MVVDMRPICVGRNNKGVSAFQEAACKLISDSIGFLGSSFTRSKGLPYLIGDDIIFLAAAGGLFIQPFRQQKFLVHRLWAASIAAYQFALFSFIGVLNIAGVVVQAGGDGLSLVFPHGNQPCGSYIITPYNTKCRTAAAFKSCKIASRSRQHRQSTWPCIAFLPARCRSHPV